MIPELGHFALILALCIAVVQSTFPLAGSLSGNRPWMTMARPLAYGQLTLVAISFACLVQAFLTDDFSVLYVASNSNSLLPPVYKVSAVWGAHEGSLLLWALMMAGWGAAVAAFSKELPLTMVARVISVQGMIAIGFLLFMLLTSNPFARHFPMPADGQDLNPLLQDFGLAIHPPMLYMGYVGFSVAFAFAIAALIGGKLDAAWARWSRPWTTIAWVFLTIGIALGSWWAYYELGWGGWWFWDPVENASFMPWLLGTALLHSAIVTEKRGALKSWTILLAIMTFSLSLLGTFLVRSGVLTSVHAFALDPERGFLILLILAAATGGALFLYARRAHLMAGGAAFAPVSREGALLLNNLLLATATATVLLGTLYPLLVDGLGLGAVSVGPPYFNATVLPLLLPLIALIGIGPLFAWKRGDLAGVLGRLKVAGVLAFVALLVGLYMQGIRPVMALVAVAFGAWAIGGAFTDLALRAGLGRAPLGTVIARAAGLPRSAWGTVIAHAGTGIAVLGMVGTSVWATEEIAVMVPGDRQSIAGYELTLTATQGIEGPNYLAERGVLEIARDGEVLGHLTPEKRWYPIAAMTTTEAGIRTTALNDLYAALGEPDEQGRWVVRLYHHPLVLWIWIGSAVMVLGGVVSLADRRLRVGAPKPAARAVEAPAGAVPAAAAGGGD